MPSIFSINKNLNNLLVFAIVNCAKHKREAKKINISKMAWTVWTEYIIWEEEKVVANVAIKLTSLSKTVEPKKYNNSQKTCYCNWDVQTCLGITKNSNPCIIKKEAERRMKSYLPLPIC